MWTWPGPLPKNWVEWRRCSKAKRSPPALPSLGDEYVWPKEIRPAPYAVDVFCVARDFQGFNVFLYNGEWYALKPGEGDFDPKRTAGYRTLLHGESEYALQQMITYHNGLPKGLWGRLWAQPIIRLPRRIWRRLGKELARLG